MDLRLQIEELVKHLNQRTDELTQTIREAPIDAFMRGEAVGEVDGIRYAMLRIQSILDQEGVTEQYEKITHTAIDRLHLLADTIEYNELEEEAATLRNLLPAREKRVTYRVSLQDALRGLRSEVYVRGRPETSPLWAVWRRDRLEHEFPDNRSYDIEAEDIDNGWVVEAPASYEVELNDETQPEAEVEQAEETRAQATG